MEELTLLQQARDAYVARDLWRAKNLIERQMTAVPTDDDLARSRVLAAVIYREIGDVHLSAEHLRCLMAEWDSYPDLRSYLEGPAWYNLGLVSRQRQEYAEAVACYGKAIGEFRRIGPEDYLRQALQNRSWVLCLLGDAEGARLDLDEAEPLAATGDAYWQQRIGRAFECYVEGGDQETVDLCRDIMEGVRVPLDVRGQAAWLGGRAQLRLGLVEQAEELAKVAQAWATEAADARLINDANAILLECRRPQQNTGA